jgi:hypothetical protein
VVLRDGFDLEVQGNKRENEASEILDKEIEELERFRVRAFVNFTYCANFVCLRRGTRRKEEAEEQETRNEKRKKCERKRR